MSPAPQIFRSLLLLFLPGLLKAQGQVGGFAQTDVHAAPRSHHRGTAGLVVNDAGTLPSTAPLSSAGAKSPALPVAATDGGNTLLPRAGVPSGLVVNTGAGASNDNNNDNVGQVPPRPPAVAVTDDGGPAGGHSGHSIDKSIDGSAPLVIAPHHHLTEAELGRIQNLTSHAAHMEPNGTHFMPHLRIELERGMECDDLINRNCHQACGRLGQSPEVKCLEPCIKTCLEIAAGCFDGGSCDKRHFHCHSPCDVDTGVALLRADSDAAARTAFGGQASSHGPSPRSSRSLSEVSASGGPCHTVSLLQGLFEMCRHSCEAGPAGLGAGRQQQRTLDAAPMKACLHTCLMGLVDHCGLPKPPRKKVRGSAGGANHAAHHAAHVKIHDMHKEHQEHREQQQQQQQQQRQQQEQEQQQQQEEAERQKQEAAKALSVGLVVIETPGGAGSSVPRAPLATAKPTDPPPVAASEEPPIQQILEAQDAHHPHVLDVDYTELLPHLDLPEVIL